MGRFLHPHCPVHGNTEAPGGGHESTVPGEMAAVVRSRLTALILALGAFSAVAFLLEAIGPRYFGWSTACAVTGSIVHGALFLIAITLAGALRRGMIAVSPALTLGLIYLVVYAFGMSFAELAVPHEAGTLPRSTLVPVLIVMFPLFVPTTLGRAAVASVAAASTGPLAAVAYSRLGGTPIPPPSEFVFAYLFNFGAVLLALIPTAIMRHMSREVSSAHRLGSYELKELIGRGGMGEVWHATHSALKRPAALKLIRQDAFGTGSGGDYATAVKRFEREAQATAALHSCHTVQVYDFGTTQEGTFFYVMELLTGLDLDTLVNRYGPLPAERVAYLIRQAAESLWDAHEANLIHRDIKPANIYVCRFGHKADTVKVLDFGLVKHTGGLLGDQTRLTKLGSTTGTPAYMSPEMALGETVIDGRADIYALGCVAYWLLTGELVFPENTAMKMALAHVREAPQRPSERTELPIPAELEELVMAMLAKDPVDRPSSAEEVIRRIDAISFESDWSWKRAQSWWDKHNPVPQRAVDVGEARAQRTVAEVVPAIG